MNIWNQRWELDGSFREVWRCFICRWDFFRLPQFETKQILRGTVSWKTYGIRFIFQVTGTLFCLPWAWSHTLNLRLEKHFSGSTFGPEGNSTALCVGKYVKVSQVQGGKKKKKTLHCLGWWPERIWRIFRKYLEFISFSEILVTFYKQTLCVYPLGRLMVGPLSNGALSAALEVWEWLRKAQMSVCHGLGPDPALSIS